MFTITVVGILVVPVAIADDPAANEPKEMKRWIIDTHTHFKGRAQIELETKAKARDPKDSDEWRRAVKQCSKYPNVYCKLSSILNFADVEPFAQPAPTDLEAYLPILQSCFDAFGEDRLIFATNWGVCNHFGKVDDVVRIATEFAEAKGERVAIKIMRDNAIRIYAISPKNLRDLSLVIALCSKTSFFPR